jgi:hypothetical protein
MSRNELKVTVTSSIRQKIMLDSQNIPETETSKERLGVLMEKTTD